MDKEIKTKRLFLGICALTNEEMKSCKGNPDKVIELAKSKKVQQRVCRQLKVHK